MTLSLAKLALIGVWAFWRIFHLACNYKKMSWVGMRLVYICTGNWCKMFQGVACRGDTATQNGGYMHCQSKAVKNGIFPPSHFLGSTDRTDTVITVGMAAQEWEKKQEFIQCGASMDCWFQVLSPLDWVVPIAGTAVKALLFLELPQIWLLRTDSWLLMVTDCKILVIARVQENFNSCLFLVNTGSTNTDMHPCCSQPCSLLFCVLLGHLQPVTRLWGSAVWSIVCALKIILQKNLNSRGDVYGQNRTAYCVS